MNERLYQFRIYLTDIEPVIWRRFVVPDCMTLDRLSDVIQIVMGWTGSHLYDFTIEEKRYTEYLEFKDDGFQSGRYRLCELMKQKGCIFSYLYDFGDCWKHELVLEENRYTSPKSGTLLTCLDGKRACPPEDVGGTPGYFEFCHALKDPNHKDYKTFVEWSGGQFDSEYFDVNTVNLDLMKYFHWSRDRSQKWGLTAE